MMNKRKASAEKNARQKATSRHPSMTSLLVRNNNSIQPHTRPEKSPSIQNLHQLTRKDSMKTVQAGKGIDVYLPKTRFSSQDRCKEPRTVSSPRLKSFPAEKIKKLESPRAFVPKPIGALIVQQNPCESGSFYVAPSPGQCQNGGQGDAIATGQSLQRQDAHYVNQQQVPAHEVGHVNPNSDSKLTQQIAPNNQPHRPFVPNTTIRDYSPRKNGTATPMAGMPVASQNVQGAAARISESAPNHTFEGTANQAKDQDGTVENDSPYANYERQPVGGRNALAHRRMAMNQKQSDSEPSADRNPTNQPNDNYQQFSSVPNTSMAQPHFQPYTTHQNPQQAYQQLQQNIARQQQMQQRAMNHQIQMMNNQQQMQVYQGVYGANAQQSGQYYTGQGMTSPQDATVNGMRNSGMTMPVPQNYQTYQRDMGHVIKPQNQWVQGNPISEHTSVKAQLKPFTVDVVNDNQAQFAARNQQQSQQHSMPQKIPPQYQQQHANAQHQLYTNAEHRGPMYQTPQNVAVQNQNAIVYGQQQTVGHQQAPVQPSSNPRPESQGKQNGKKKVPQFTPEMIRDQELLVATMKQQGIPDDIMRRQFDALLNEQRKHLLYLEGVHQEEEKPQPRTPAPVRKRRQMDEKPEWMVHITPPRLPYSEIERMRADENQKQRKVNENPSEEEKTQQMMQHQQHQQHQQMNPASNQQVPHPVHPQNQQMYQLWQQSNWQRNVPPTYNNNMYPIVANSNDPTKPMMYHQHHQHPLNVPHYQYVQNGYQMTNPNIQQASQMANPNVQQHPQVSNQNQAQINEMNGGSPRKPAAREEGRIPTEPSSLLQMRLYKQLIKPQKRNNGLQDPSIAQKALEALMKSENNKGLKYLANLTKKKAAVSKLNGIQEPGEVEAEIPRIPMEHTIQTEKKVAANGLENTRNPNNPPLKRLTYLKKSDGEYIKEYPRQRQSNRNCYSVQPEKDSNAPVTQQQNQSPPTYSQPGHDKTNVIPYNEKNPTTARNQVMPFRFNGTYPQHYQQMQQYHHNTQQFYRNNGEGDIAAAQQEYVQNKANVNRAGGDTGDNFTAGDGQQNVQNKIMQQHGGDVPRDMNTGQSDIHETRTIGGIKFRARKQDFIPNTPIISPEILNASRHLQPPILI